MKRLTIDGLRAFLPELDELRPLVDHLLASSRVDETRTWSESGALGTAGSRLVDAAELLQRSQALAEREHEHTRTMFALTAEAIAHVEAGRHHEAASALLSAAALEEARDRPDRAEGYANAAVQIVRGRPTEESLASLALRRRARARRTLGRYSEAARDYEEAHTIAEAATDPRGAAEALIGAGNVYEEQGLWSDAEARYRSALSVLDTTEVLVPERWHALLNLHVVLRSAGSLDASLEPLERASEIAAAIDDSGAAAFLENARGQLRMAHDDFRAAEEHLRRALDASGSPRAAITIRLNLAECLLAQRKGLDAAEEARRAEKESLVARLPQKLPEVYRILGRIAAHEGSTNAFVLFERALEIIADRGLPSIERAQTLQAYAEAERRVGDEETAAGLHEEADRLYADLGIERMRRAWSDRFDAGTDGPEPDIKGTRND